MQPAGDTEGPHTAPFSFISLDETPILEIKREVENIDEKKDQDFEDEKTEQQHDKNHVIEVTSGGTAPGNSLKAHNVKLYCRKCGEAFNHKCDLFNHMFLHISIILAEAQYINSRRSQQDAVEVKDKIIEEKDTFWEERQDRTQDSDSNKGDNDFDYFGDEANDVIDDTIKLNDIIKEEPTLDQVIKTEDIDYSVNDECLQVKKVQKIKKKKKKSIVVKHENKRKRRRKGEEATVYECNDCSYKSTELWAMRKHCVIHLPNNPFKCPLCEFSCKTRFSLKSHFSRHTGEKKYKCEYCGISFRTRSIWARHVEIHNDKNHTCHICGKKFYRGDSLRYHEMTHSDQRPYKCHLCPYGAKHPRTLKIHIENHDEMQKKYSCPSCDFKTSRRSTLKIHFKVHNSEAQYKCDQCTFSCRALTTLKKHSEVHKTYANVFSCTECEFISTTERAVMRHLRQHQHIPLKVLQMKVKASNRCFSPRS